jgi:hypothetical protein
MESTYLSDIQKSPFLFLQDHPWDYYKPIANTLNTSTSGQICDDETFYRTFMSEINRDYINSMIKKTVYNNSCDNYIVRDQKREHLEQIMKGLYNDYAQHLPFNQKQQFSVLNKLVVDYCVKSILSEINIRFKYMRDKFSPLEPLPTPINTSTTGSRSFLPTMSSIYDPTLYFNKSLPTSPAPGPTSGPSQDVFNTKIITNSADPTNLTYQPYYFTDEKTNMFAKQKSVTTNPTKTTRFYTPDYPDLSYPVREHKLWTGYVSNPAPAPVNYYIPQSEQTRSRFGF